MVFVENITFNSKIQKEQLLFIVKICRQKKETIMRDFVEKGDKFNILKENFLIALTETVNVFLLLVIFKLICSVVSVFS